MDETTQSLVQLAIAATRHAYIPYSHYPVGAALRALDGTVYSGCNIESASYTPTICAERTALAKAVSEGRQSFDVCVVATRNFAMPCGVCRQFLYEFAPNLRIISANLQGEIQHDVRLTDILPYGFGPGDAQ